MGKGQEHRKLFLMHAKVIQKLFFFPTQNISETIEVIALGKVLIGSNKKAWNNISQ